MYNTVLADDTKGTGLPYSVSVNATLNPMSIKWIDENGVDLKGTISNLDLGLYNQGANPTWATVYSPVNTNHSLLFTFQGEANSLFHYSWTMQDNDGKGFSVEGQMKFWAGHDAGGVEFSLSAGHYSGIFDPLTFDAYEGTAQFVLIIRAAHISPTATPGLHTLTYTGTAEYN